MAEPPPYSFDDIVDLEVPEDDFLVSLGWVTAYLSSIQPMSWGSTLTPMRMPQQKVCSPLRAVMRRWMTLYRMMTYIWTCRRLSRLLHLSSDSLAPTLIMQGQGDIATTELLPSLVTLQTSMTTSCTTSETTPADNSERANGIDLTLEEDDDDDYDNSG